MCPPSGGRRPIDDLTARARIRDAALALFGEHGYHGATIRDVAGRAGVSAGLVQHHFGSKQGLRDACDAHALETLRATVEAKLEREVYDADFVSALYEASLPVLKYVARGWSEGWPGSAALFDMSAEGTATWLSRLWPDRFPAGSAKLRRHAATMVSMNLGPIVLHDHLARWLGAEPLERRQHHLTGMAMLEIYSVLGEFIASEAGRSVRDAGVEFGRRIEGSGADPDDE